MTGVALTLGLAGCAGGSTDPLADANAAYERHEYAAARIHILSALQEDSSNIKANLMFGKIMLAVGDGEGASAAFRKVMIDPAYKKQALPLYAHALLLTGASDKALETIGSPENPSLSAQEAAKYYWVKACALLDLGRVEEALSLIDDGLTRTPENVDLLVLKAKTLIPLGEVRVAKGLAAQALQAGPDDLEALQLSGRLAMMDQDLETAKTRFAKAARLYPDSIIPLFSLAAIHSDLGEEKMSRDYFGRILKKVPQHPLALFMLAKLEYDKGKISEAHEMLQVAGEGVADVPQAILLSGQIAHARGNHEIAIARLQRYLGLFPDDVEGITALGRALLAAGNGAQAYTLVKPAAMRATASSELLKLAAKLAEQQKDPAARAFTTRAKQAGSGSIDQQMKKAERAMAAGDWPQASAIYASLRDAGNQDNPVVLNNSALVALQMEQPAEAEKLARAAYALAPEDAFIMDTLGWILLQRGNDKAQALTLIRKAADLAPDNTEILGHLARAYAANGDSAAAEQITIRLKGIKAPG